MQRAAGSKRGGESSRTVAFVYPLPAGSASIALRRTWPLDASETQRPL